MRAVRTESFGAAVGSAFWVFVMIAVVGSLANASFAADGGMGHGAGAGGAATQPVGASPGGANDLQPSAVPASAPLPAPTAAPALRNASAPDAPAKSSPSAEPPAPDYRVICQYVLTDSYFDGLKKLKAANSQLDTTDPTDCATVSSDEDARVLNGPGDLMVVVPQSGYEDALKRTSNTAQLRLFLNGFDLGADGLIASAQRGSKGVALRFRVPNKKDSQAFWTTVYSEHGIIEKVPLEASVGWAGNPAFIRGANWAGVDLQVSVTNTRALVAEGILASLLIWFFFWALFGSDTFREAPTYPWWNDARSLQTKLHRATVPYWQWPFKRRKNVELNLTNSKIEKILTAYFPTFASANEGAYRDAAKKAIGELPSSADETKEMVIGLALTSDWGKFRLPFSLAKVQWGGWTMFATTAAVFLWLVYARFPVLDGSVLGLVALSTLTAGASLIIDNTSDKKNISYSQGFFHDIMTDSDGVQQAHWYQAIVVSVLLFAVGLVYVCQHLAYPTFDPSWLELLGISGLAQVAGKGTLENKK